VRLNHAQQGVRPSTIAQDDVAESFDALLACSALRLRCASLRVTCVRKHRLVLRMT